MGRYLVWVCGLVACTLLGAAPAAAQVDIGVWTPHGGGRVVLGAPRVYYPPPPPPPVYAYPAPVYVAPYDYSYYYPRYRGPRGLPPGHLRKQARLAAPYYVYPPYPGRAYRGYGYARPSYRGDHYVGGGGGGRRR